MVPDPKSLDPLARAALAKVARRAAFARGSAALLDGAAAAATAVAVFGLALRGFDRALPLEPLLALALLPAGGYAVFAAWRARPKAGEAALFLDRKLGLRGLLLAGLERDGALWQQELRARIAGRALPRPRARLLRPLARSSAALALLAVVLLLPPPARATPPVANPLVAGALDDLQQSLDQAVAEALVERKTEQDLRAKVDALKERAAEGDKVPWSDLDDVAEALERAAAERAAELARTSEELAALAAAAAAATEAGDAASAAAAAQIAEALAKAAEAGLLDTALSALSTDARAALEALARDAAGGGRWASELAAAASQLGAALDARLAELAAKGLAERRASGARLAEVAAAKIAKKPGHQHTPECRSGGT